MLCSVRPTYSQAPISVVKIIPEVTAYSLVITSHSEDPVVSFNQEQIVVLGPFLFTA